MINLDDYTVLSDAEAELDLESMILAESQVQEDPANKLHEGASSHADKENMPPTEEQENIPPAKKQKVVKNKIQKKKNQEGKKNKASKPKKVIKHFT